MKKLTDRAAFLENKIAAGEAAIAQLEARLAVFVNAEETQRVSTDLDRTRAEVAQFETEWAELQDEIAAVTQ